MKKIFLTLFAFAAVCGSAQAQKQPRVATVDVERVLSQYGKASDQRDLLRGDEQEAQKRLREEEQAILALRHEAERAQQQSEDKLLTEAGRVDARKLLEDKVRNFQARANQFEQKKNNIEQTIRVRAQAMQEIVLADLRPVVNQVAKDKGADLVLGSTFNPGGVLFADASLDITDEVVKRLNADYTPRPKPAPAPAAAPVTTSAPASAIR